MTDTPETAPQLREALTDDARRLRREMTPAETAVWDRLRDHGLRDLHFRRQERIGKFIADFCCRPARLVVELDGEVHLGQAQRDEERDRWLLAHGWHVLRFRNEEVLESLEKVLRDIGEAALKRL
jgi:very-short-patch-repair endonuclease